MQPNNQQNNEMEIDLKELFLVIWNKLALIALVALVCGLGTFILTKFYVTPVYESTTKVYVYNKQAENNMSVSDLQLGAQLTKDYKELIVCRPVLEGVIQELQLPIAFSDLKNSISISTPTDTRIIAITVENKNAQTAKQIADAVRESASEHIMNVMDIQAVNTVEEASLATAPSKPSVVKNSLIGFILGAFVTIFVILLRHMLNDTIKSPEDVERYLGLSTLASIPLVDSLSGHDKKGKSKNKR